MFKLYIVTCLVTQFNFFTVANAKEGFNDAFRDLPQSPQSSVFLFLDDAKSSYHIGTAFLVAEDQNYYYLTTNNHVAKSGCDDSGACPSVKLYQSGFIFEREDGSLQFNSDWPYLSKVQVIIRYENPDYAVLRADKKPSTNFFKGWIPKPLKISTRSPKIGEKLYTIGFPDIRSRTCTGQRKIERRDTIFKRWSTGIYVGKFRSDDNNNVDTRYWMGTTIDALGGSSGGPILNEANEVVGIIQKSASQNDGKGGCYTGNETPEHLDWQSLGVTLTPN